MKEMNDELQRERSNRETEEEYDYTNEEPLAEEALDKYEEDETDYCD